MSSERTPYKRGRPARIVGVRAQAKVLSGPGEVTDYMQMRQRLKDYDQARRLERITLLRRAHSGEPLALAELWRRYRVRVTIVPETPGTSKT